MSELHIDLSPQTQTMLFGAAEARHVSVEEFVREAVEALAARDAQEINAIRAGLAQADAGRCLPHAQVVAAVDNLLASNQ